MSSEGIPSRLWGRRLFVVLLPLLLIPVWCLHDSRAHVQITTPDGVGLFWSSSQATLNLRLGCPPNENLSTWGPCWDDAARDAAQQWNSVGAQFKFRIQSPSRSASVACDSSATDGINTVAWADTHCGMAWDDTMLALTQNWFYSTGELIDSDVLFNTNMDWTTYSGPQRPYAFDFHRVALHEFGHVLGLAHPDEHGQSVNAIMNSKTDDNDRLQADDIAGIRAIYNGSDDDHGDTRQEVTGDGSGNRGVLENPGQGASKSGIGVISGWKCEAAGPLTVRFNGGNPIPLAYGNERSDTQAVCGDTNNGFVSIWNWGNLGDGSHTAVVYDAGVEFARSTFRATTFGQEFLRGARKTVTVPGFPHRGTTTVLEWEESSQNFVIRDVW